MKRTHAILTGALALAVGASVALAAPALAHGPGGWFGRGGPDAERGERLANELGITVEDLQAAQLRALEKGLTQAVDNGRLTQEQSDLMLAGAKLRQSIDRDAMAAATLGISAEELAAAQKAGKTLRDLVTELGLDRQTMAQNAQAAMQEAVDQAVKDGVITQAQADALQEAKSGLGGGLRHGRGGWERGSGLGQGSGSRPGGAMPAAPGSDNL